MERLSSEINFIFIVLLRRNENQTMVSRGAAAAPPPRRRLAARRAAAGGSISRGLHSLPVTVSLKPRGKGLGLLFFWGNYTGLGAKLLLQRKLFPCKYPSEQTTLLLGYSNNVIKEEIWRISDEIANGDACPTCR